MTSDGMTHWRLQGTRRSGRTIMRPTSAHNQASLSLECDPGSDSPADYAHEAWSQASRFLFHERRIFGDHPPLQHAYVRAFSGPCELLSDAVRITVYPVMKVWETGAASIHLRVIGPVGAVPLVDFIGNWVNLFQHGFDGARVPPGLASIAPRAYLAYSEPRAARRRDREADSLHERHDQAVAALTAVDQSAEFEYEFAPLPRSAEDKETIKGLAMTMLSALGVAISGLHTASATRLLRRARALPSFGAYWSGRPNVHLVRFTDQQDTAS